MRHVERSEILDYQTYEDHRDEVRRHVLAVKEPRRVHVGRFLTFLFENTETVRYQIQEMVRAERMVREADIQHEIETYNELLGGPGELGCTLLIEIDDPAERDAQLRRLRDLPRHVYAVLEDGSRVRPSFDPRQIGEDRLSAVQYLKLPLRGRVPVALGVDHPELTIEEPLTERQQQALREDLTS